MGTKQNPGPHDCYAAAQPNEPLFILLARDPLAPILVDLWATLRTQQRPGDSDKAGEAYDTACDMREWALRKASVKREHFLWCDEYHTHSAPACCGLSCWCRRTDG